jgi:hypothetical protein
MKAFSGDAFQGFGDTGGSPVLHRHTAGVRKTESELPIRFHSSAKFLGLRRF